MSETTGQLSLAEVKNMKPEDVAAARAAGRLDSLLAGNDPGRLLEPFVPPVTDADQGARGQTYRSQGEWLRTLNPEQVVRLRREGLLDDYLCGDVQ